MKYHIVRARFLLAITALAVAGTLTVTPFQAAANDNCQFADVPESSGSDVVYACQQGWFEGYPDGTFQPNRRIPQHQIATVINRAFPTGATRADMATFLRGGNPGDPAGPAGFPDVPPAHPQHQDIAYAKEKGWFTGYPDGNFRPEQSITPAQIVTVLQRAFPTGSTRADLAAFMRNGNQALTTTTNQLSDDIGNWAWSPTRNQIAYTTTVQDTEGNELSELRVATPDGSTTRKLYDTIHNIRSFRWSPTGDKIAYIVVTRDERGERLREGLLVVSTENQTQNILIDPITIKSLKWADTVPTWVAGEGQRISFTVNNIIWSPSGSKISFTLARSTKRLELWVAEVDGSNTPVIISKSEIGGLYLRIEWSSDGNHIAYKIYTFGEDDSLWVTGTDNSNTRQLSNSGQSWQWSPNGDRIAYYVGSELWIAEADGSNTQKLSNNGYGQWSPIGNQIAYTVSVLDAQGNRNSELWIAEADGSNTQKLSNNGYGQWSPIGNQIAYTVSVLDAQGNRSSELWVTEANGPATRRLSNQIPQISRWKWSPDGRRITYIVIPDEYEHWVGDLWVVNTDGSSIRKLSNNVYVGSERWSPNGNHITYMVYTPSHEYELWVTDADGSNTQKISSKINQDSMIWSPNGDHIAYTVSVRETQDRWRKELWVTGVDGSNTQRLSNQISDWKWSPGGNHIAYTINERNWQGDRRELWTTKVNQ